MNKLSSVKTVLMMLGFFWAMVASAAPNVVGVTGAPSHGSQLTISGTGFGTKNPAKPYLWAPFDGSANPSPLGIVQSWNLDSMAFSPNEGFAGSGGLKATNSSGIWTAHVIAQGFAWNDWNQKMYLFRRIKQNFDVVNNNEVSPPEINWKILRIWGANFTYPDFYMQVGNGNMTTEGVADSTAWMDHLGKMDILRGTKDVWRLDEIEYRSNSAPALSDGEFRYWVGGELVTYLPHRTYVDRYFKLRDASSEGSAPMTMFFAVHGVKANTTFPSHYRYWADDVYLDTTWARVMIGNAPTLAASSHREIQIPTAWSSNSITVSVNIRSFPSGVTPYLFVINSVGEVSNGISLQQGGATLSPPTNLTVTPPQ